MLTKIHFLCCQNSLPVEAHALCLTRIFVFHLNQLNHFLESYCPQLCKGEDCIYCNIWKNCWLDKSVCLRLWLGGFEPIARSIRGKLNQMIMPLSARVFMWGILGEGQCCPWNAACEVDEGLWSIFSRLPVVNKASLSIEEQTIPFKLMTRLATSWVSWRILSYETDNLF